MLLHALRLLYISVSFTIACLMGFIFVLLRPFNPDNTRRCAHLFAIPGVWGMGIKMEVDMQHLHAQPRACVSVLNHQSNWDILILARVVTANTVTVGKHSLMWLPIFGQIYWLAGNILINRTNPKEAKQAMLKTTHALKDDNTSIWIFPEGTRNHGKGLLPFKRGAFLTAINAGVPIVPVCCSSYHGHIRLNRWHAGTVAIRTLPPIHTEGLSPNDASALMDRCREDMLRCIAELDAECARKDAAIWGGK